MDIVNYRGYPIKIVPDENSESPNAWGDENLFLVGFHRDFYVNRDGFSQGLCESIQRGGKYEDDSINEEAKEAMKKYHIFLLEAYIHSGVSLSLHNGTKKDKWDSSVLGMVFVAKEEWKTRTKAEEAAKGLLEEWNDYLSGNIYGFHVEDKQGDEIDSCYGFYGYDYEKSGLLDTARDSIDSHIQRENKKHEEKLKIQIFHHVPLEKRVSIKI